VATVSILIPAFNQSQYLRQAVDSALAQTRTDIEIVVVDDGSTDDTPQVLAGYAGEPRLRVIRQDNAGLAAARNRALREATGQYLCFLDSDDALLPDAVERHLAILEGDAGVAFTYSDVRIIDDQGAIQTPHTPVHAARTVVSGDILDSLILGGYFPPVSVMLRRGILDAAGSFDPALGGHADYDLWLRISAAGGRAVYIGEPLALYRRHPAGMSRDAVHMRATRAMALTKLARQAPARLASGLAYAQDLLSEMHAANAALHVMWRRLQDRLWWHDDLRYFDFTEQFETARRTVRTPDAAAVWGVEMGGETCRALFLHPTARLEYVVPTGAAGLLTGQLGLHPAVWDNPEARPVRFHVEVDDVTKFETVLNPSATADRRWRGFELPVPAAAEAEHRVVIATTYVERPTFCWALWRDVRFGWRAIS
jgi:glycosyltransferase involved in cell wall biosynthesis